MANNSSIIFAFVPALWSSLLNICMRLTLYIGTYV